MREGIVTFDIFRLTTAEGIISFNIFKLTTMTKEKVGKWFSFLE